MKNELNTSDSIQWGIIGCGNVTEVKSGPAFNKVPNSSLAAVMRRDSEKAKDYAKRHDVPLWFDDAIQLINHPGVNAIYVATPPKFHEAFTIAALQAGKPVYVEKPMAMDTAACLRMLAVSKETQVKLCIAHYRRALPKFLKIKALLASKVIGQIRLVQMKMLQTDKSSIIAGTEPNCRINPAIAGAGLFFDLAPHQLDLMMFFFGSPLETFGISANQAELYEAEDIVTGIMRLPEDILFSGVWCYTVGEGIEEDLCEIIGSKGKISFPIFDHRLCIQTGTKQETEIFQPPTHIQQPMIEKVVQYFLGHGPNPCSATDAIESMRVMEDFLKNPMGKNT